MLDGNIVAAGRPSNEPVALISQATTPNQKMVTTTLRDCVAQLKEHDLKPPMLIVVGPIVAYGEKFSGQEK